MSFYIVEITGTYGGQWYCCVKANTSEEANEKVEKRFPHHWDDNEKSMVLDCEELSEEILPDRKNPPEIKFDAEGISTVWFVGW